MKVLTVGGARPNFVKIAPIMRALAEARQRYADMCIEPLLVDTGQHYDDPMSAALFRDLQIRPPHWALHVGSGSHGAQTAAVLSAVEGVLVEAQPDIVLVVGDVNSTLAAALAAAKLGIPVAHVEAGLRSFDRSMPEEINRRLTDALADFLFTTEANAAENLRREGVPPEKIFFVGNVMVDSLRWAQRSAPPSTVLERLGLCERRNGDGFAVATLHRPANVDSPHALGALLDALTELAKDLPLILLLHPRTRGRLQEFGLSGRVQTLNMDTTGARPARGCVSALDAVPYIDCLQLLENARLVLTDSGGVQEETTCLGVPCLTVRDSTERPVTVHAGTNVIAGTAPADILRHARRALAARVAPRPLPPLWDGHAAERIVEILVRAMRTSESQ